MVFAEILQACTSSEAYQKRQGFKLLAEYTKQVRLLIPNITTHLSGMSLTIRLSRPWWPNMPMPGPGGKPSQLLRRPYFCAKSIHRNAIPFNKIVKSLVKCPK